MIFSKAEKHALTTAFSPTITLLQHGILNHRDKTPTFYQDIKPQTHPLHSQEKPENQQPQGIPNTPWHQLGPKKKNAIKATAQTSPSLDRGPERGPSQIGPRAPQPCLSRKKRESICIQKRFIWRKQSTAYLHFNLITEAKVSPGVQRRLIGGYTEGGTLPHPFQYDRQRCST